jgi:hypothetical protein
VATIALGRRLIGVVWRMLKDGVSFREAQDGQLAERKRRRYEGEVRRLKRMRAEYGTEAFRVLITQALRESKGTVRPLSSHLHS